MRVVAADTKSNTLARNQNALNNSLVFHRKTAGPALDNRILSDDLEVNVKSDSPASALSDKLVASKMDNLSERLLSNLDASKLDGSTERLDGSTERLDDKATGEKNAH